MKTICSLCNKKEYAKGLCSYHYRTQPEMLIKLKQYNKIYYAKNKEYLQEYGLKYRKEHLESIKQYRLKNKEYSSQWHKKWYVENKPKCAKRIFEYTKKNKVKGKSFYLFKHQCPVCFKIGWLRAMQDINKTTGYSYVKLAFQHCRRDGKKFINESHSMGKHIYPEIWKIALTNPTFKEYQTKEVDEDD
jgi:hypothetical protein